MPTSREIIRFSDDAPPPGENPWVQGGPSPDEVRVVDPDPGWPAAYDGLAEVIRGALGTRAIQLEHVGSTSVPGLPAKPVIDIDLIVADPADEPGYLPALERAGFELRVREPWWHQHRCLRHSGPRCNLHVFGPDAPEPWKHRIFRDWLRANPEDVERYRDAKLSAAAATRVAGGHTMEYNRRKEQVVREIYIRAFRAAGLTG